MPPQDVIAQLQTSLVGRYDIDRKIGAGGMATVYLARDVKHDRNVALKLLDPELGAVLGAERFLSEIKVTANLQHPNLLPLFDSGEAGGLLFYVMPYVEGESLRARLQREKQLPVDEAVRIASAVASALDYAHRHGVIHRDLKPENILLHEGQPLVADFGIALAVSNAGGNRITQTGLSLGTPQYMSPEQATGDRVIDGRSDIYSLGAVLYEMLTGDAPHTGSTAQAIIARILTDKPRSVRLSRESVPPHVEFAIDKALAKLPADRWATAREFEDALRGRGAGGAPLPTWGGTAQQAATPASSARAQARAMLPWALAALGAAGSAWGWSAAHRDVVRPTVRFPLTYSADVRSTSGTGTSITISPDGRVIAFLGRGKGRMRQLFLRTLDDMRTREVAGTENAMEPFFSPDSRWLGFWADNKLQKVLVEGGPALRLADMPVPTGVSWGASGSIVVVFAGELATLPDGGGVPRTLAKVDSAKGETSKRWPLALSDGKTVLYTSWRGGTGERIGVVSLESGAATVLDLQGTFPLGVLDGTLVYATMSGALMAVPFDVRRGRVTGDPTPVVTDVVVGSGGAAKAGLSLGGSLVYESGSSTSELALVDAHGALRKLPLDAKGYAYPRFSPDGRRIAVNIRTGNQVDVWIHDLASGTTSRLTTVGTVNERPEWSPDGKRVLFQTNRSAIDTSTRAARQAGLELWWQPSDLSGQAEPLLKLPGTGVVEGVLGPDGRTLVYKTVKSDIWYRRLGDDTVSKPIATTTFLEQTPRLSPDGRWVAYSSNESGTYEVFVQPMPGPGGRTQVSIGGGMEPVWARDGRRLFYRDNSRFIAAAVTTAPAFAVVSRSTFVDDAYGGTSASHATYDISPDGTQLLVVKPAGEPALMIVHDWRTELRARMAPQAPK